MWLGRSGDGGMSSHIQGSELSVAVFTKLQPGEMLTASLVSQ